MKRGFITIPPTILIVLILLLSGSNLAWASGVNQIIAEQDSQDIENTLSDPTDDFTEPFDESEVPYPNFEGFDPSNDGSTSGGSADSSMTDDEDADSYYKVVLSIQSMRGAISQNIGVPDANYLVLILFALAALLQMARVGYWGGDWVAFVVRVIVVLGFLQCYSTLFNGAELFFNHLSSEILGGESAYETFWSNQEMIQGNLAASVNYNKSWFSVSSLIYLAVLLSFVVSYAMYVLIYLAQACILIVLQYLGPILIAMALIPETNFTGGFLSTFFLTQSWTVIIAILLKVMSTATEISAFQQVGMPDFIAISTMNICYALSFYFVPTAAGMIFNGSGLGGMGAALITLGKGATSQTVSMIRSRFSSAGKNIGNKAFTPADTGPNKSQQKPKSFSRSALNIASKGARYAGEQAMESLSPKISYTMDHIKRLTPAGRARFNEKYNGNNGADNSNLTTNKEVKNG